jgi:hypothetical protein
MKGSALNHYELAFEHWLIDHGVDYFRADDHERLGPPTRSVKNFDFLLCPDAERRVIAEVKGRTFRGTSVTEKAGFECWVTRDDVESLTLWRRILGAGHEAAFVFAYRVAQVDVDFDGRDAFAFNDERYLFFCVRLDDYRRHMKRRSPKWQTVTLPAEAFRRCAVFLREFLS